QLELLLGETVKHPAESVAFQLALSAGSIKFSDATRAAILKQCIEVGGVGNAEDPWIRTAILSSSEAVAGELLQKLVDSIGSRRELIRQLAYMEEAAQQTATARAVL